MEEFFTKIQMHLNCQVCQDASINKVCQDASINKVCQDASINTWKT